MLSQDYVRAAAARGAGRARVLLVHALRDALLPVATLATQQGPMALGGAFVVERVLSLRGIGELIMLAVSRRRAHRRALGGRELAYAALDPRLRAAVLGRKGRT